MNDFFRNNNNNNNNAIVEIDFVSRSTDVLILTAQIRRILVRNSVTRVTNVYERRCLLKTQSPMQTIKSIVNNKQLQTSRIKCNLSR